MIKFKRTFAMGLTTLFVVSASLVNGADFKDNSMQVRPTMSQSNKRLDSQLTSPTVEKATNTKLRERAWYSAEQLRAIEAKMQHRLPYDFGLGEITKSHVSDDAVVHIYGHMKAIFNDMPAYSQELLITASLKNIKQNYCLKATSSQNILAHVRVIHVVITDDNGRVLVEKNYNPQMCEKE